MSLKSLLSRERAIPRLRSIIKDIVNIAQKHLNFGINNYKYSDSHHKSVSSFQDDAPNKSKV